jgi:hypothetical protein
MRKLIGLLLITSVIILDINCSTTTKKPSAPTTFSDSGSNDTSGPRLQESRILSADSGSHDTSGPGIKAKSYQLRSAKDSGSHDTSGPSSSTRLLPATKEQLEKKKKDRL